MIMTNLNLDYYGVLYVEVEERRMMNGCRSWRACVRVRCTLFK